MKKILLTIVGLIILIAIILLGKLGCEISNVSKPIKTYKYLGTINQLLAGVKKYTSTRDELKFEILDTTGNSDIGHAIYFNIYQNLDKHNIEYGFECVKGESKNKSEFTILYLIKAYDKTYNVGGYYIEGKGVRQLTNKFETDILLPLRKVQNIELIPMN